MQRKKALCFQAVESGRITSTLHKRCMEGPMALWWDRQVSFVPGIKRTHPIGRRAFPCGVPPPYAWPQPTFLGGEPARVKCEDEDRARAVDNTRFGWEQRVEQKLSAILARMDVSAGAMAATETADTATANKPFAVNLTLTQRTAEALRTMPGGMGWKAAMRELKKLGIEPSLR